MISYFTSKVDQKSINQKRTNKKEPYSNDSGIQERAELAAALKQVDYNILDKINQERQSITAVFFDI